MTETTTLTLLKLNADARDLPNGMWLDVIAVLRHHGLDPHPADVVMALAGVIDKTPVDKGGRLLPDGTVQR